MFAKLVIVLGALALVSPVCPQEQTDQGTSRILKKLSEIDERLNRIEREIEQVRAVVNRLAEEAPRGLRPLSGIRPLDKSPRPPEGAVGPELLRDAAQIWQAMGDPKEIARRLDSLVEAFSPSMSDEKKRDEFKKEVETLKKKIGKEVSEEEVFKAARERLSERIAAASNEREKDWLRRQLEAFERSEGADRKARIDRFMRIENIGALHELARKYSIPREQMVACGLAFVGYHWRPPGELPPPEGERRREGRAPKPPRPPREKSRR